MGRSLSYSELLSLSANSEYTLIKAFRDYILCIITILLFAYVADLTRFLHESVFKLASVLCVLVGTIPPIILYSSDQLVRWRNRRSTLSWIEQFKVRELGNEIYVIKYPKTGVYELTDTHVFIRVTPEQLTQIKVIEDAMAIIAEYKSS